MATAIAVAGFAVAAGTAGAHPASRSAPLVETWLKGTLAEHWNSHGAAGSVAGRESVPPREEGLDLVGKFDLAGKLAGEGRVADVSAKGNFAYLTMFYEPACGRGGVQVVDISNPAAPKAAAYIPSHVDTFSGEGSQVVTMNTPSFKGDLLVYQNEWCPGTTNGVGGISLVDVTKPRQPKKLVEGAGDFTKKDGSQSKGVPQTKANQTHSAFAWEQRDSSGNKTGKVFVVLVDDLEEPDVDILDISNPSKPKIVSETNLDQFAQTGPTRPHGDAVFSHDMIVKHIGGRDIMLMSYWDGGYVTLDVTNPASPAPLSDTDFASIDPARVPYGQTITPEGNAHEAEFTRDNEFFFATDEDFDPYRVVATYTGGPAAGKTFTAIQGSETPPVNKDNPLAGETRYLGLACEAVPAAGGDVIAVVERGVCDFQVKLDIVEAAGYSGLIVFNRTGVDGCETLVTMLAASDTTPAIFVSRQDGFRLLGVEPDADYTCSEDGSGTATPAGPSVPVDISATFDGWGYTHMYRTDLSEGAKMDEVDIYAPEEGQLEEFAENFGDMSVHEVATDPDQNLVYVSHYALGMRVLSYDDSGLEEVGAFVEPGGSNYWGVEVHRLGSQKYILGSDRDRGLRIFQYDAGG
ncbi:MAG TPA: PA domain-containing protein [Thermoleophilaceae bacterium]|nr:PA domain-containing protein [Thermoleophilaceae bacterium]